MKQLAPMALAMLLQACSPAANAPEPTPSTLAQPPAVLKPPPQASEAPAQVVANPKRIYQLKDLQRVTLKANGHEIPAWVMDTDGKREEGMMFLTDKEVKQNEGMIFVFAKSSKQNFWMENTILPLDIIYIADKGSVVNIQKGKSFDRTGLPSTGPALYVLELKQGSASRLGIKAGTMISIPKGLNSKD